MRGGGIKNLKKYNHDRTFSNILETSRTFYNFIEKVRNVLGTYLGNPNGKGG